MFQTDKNIIGEISIMNWIGNTWMANLERQKNVFKIEWGVERFAMKNSTGGGRILEFIL